MDFWIEVEAYRRLPRQQRKEQARAISERYLIEGAPFAISSSALFAHVVPAALKECGAQSNGRIRTSLFEEAQQYALRTIVESDLHRFHTSKSKPGSALCFPAPAPEYALTCGRLRVEAHRADSGHRSISEECR